MSVRIPVSSSTPILAVFLLSLVQANSAQAGDGLLWLPFSIGTRTPGDCRGSCSATGVCIFCKWLSCVNGTAYDHFATDYGCTSNNTEVRASADGEVIYTRRGIPQNTFPLGGAYGNIVKIRHETGHETWYAHLLPNTIRVQMGDHVVAGQLLALSDNTGQSTGPHLHFEVRDASGRKVNPYGDPSDYTGGCGPGALWVTCPPTPAPPPDADGDGFTVAQGDCNDTNRDIHPGAAESCNGFDDDCNGTPDDPWREGLSIDLDRPCTVGIGACTSTGVWVCAPDGRATVCSVDPLPPQPELCNSLDDDCDGSTDEDWRTGLTTDLDQPCTITWDTCRGSTTGAWVCTPDGFATACDALEPEGRRPSDEICNGIDDDCDDAIDEDWRVGLAQDVGNPCEMEIPVCGIVSGFWRCAPDGLATVCTPTEICNGRDDDCNSLIDDVAPEVLASDPFACGSCDRPCPSPFTRCIGGHCYIGCGSPTSLCDEYCRIRYCPNCGGGCDPVIDECYRRCDVDPGASIGDNASAQDCACRRCLDCCCVSAGGFTECWNPCR